jgi:uncharacterized membrane protein YkoI
VAGAVAIALAVVALARAGENEVTSEEAASAGASALRAVGGGEVASVERSSEGEAAWSIDVVQGSQTVEVSLDARLRPLEFTAEPLDEERSNPDLAAIADQLAYRRGVREELREDKQLPRNKRGRAARAVREAVGGGRVVYVEESEDRGEAYEVDLRQGGTDLEVILDRRFEILRVDRFR